MNIKELRELLANAPDDLDLDSVLPKSSPEMKLITPEIATEIPIPTYYTTIKHACNLGDIVASLAACKKYYDVTKRKIRFLQQTNLAAAYYPGAVHGTVDEDGTMVTVNQQMFNMVKPLIESQEYIESMQVYTGQPVDLDFHVIRGKTNVNLPHGSIQAWLFYAFPDLDYDISKPWMFLPDGKNQIEEVTKDKIIINFTERYRSGVVDYFFLKEYAPDLIFAGTEREHWLFCNKWQLTIPRLEVNDFLELAYALRSCRFLLSNQSFLWNLASSMNVPRVLEVCSYAQNCLPFYGANNYGYFYQVALVYYFRKLYNDTK